METEQKKVQIVLEVLDTGQGAMDQATARLQTLATTQTVVAQTSAASQKAVNGVTTSLGQTSNAAKIASQNKAALNQNIQATKASMQAFRSVITMVGMQAFPQLSGVMAIASSSMDVLKEKAGLTSAALGKIGVIGAVLAAGTWATTASFESLWNAENNLAANEAVTKQTADLRKHIAALGEQGELTEEQVSKLFTTLSSPDIDFSTLAKVRQEIKAIETTRLPASQIDQLSSRIESLGLQYEQTMAQSDQMNARQAMVLGNDTLALQAQRYQELNRELGKHQQELQAKLNLGRDDIRQNEEWLDLQVKREQAMAASAQVQRRMRDAERELQAQQLQGTRNMFSDMAASAQAFGREGFLAYKIFASAAAVVDTYRSATAAYAAMAGIPYVGPVLAVAAAAAAIGAGLANVAAINSQSFATGGFTGEGGKYQPAGVVHRGEYVFTKEDVARIGLSNIAAFRFGRMSAPVQLPNYSGSFANGGLVGQAQVSAPNVNIGFLDNRQDRREWARKDGIKVVMSELQRRGNKVRL